jgi:ABC-2 type transport system permease protein
MSAAAETVAVPEVVVHPVRPFYWSVRRELWEYPSLFFAPLAVAGVILIAFFFNVMRLPHSVEMLASLTAAHQRAAGYSALTGVALLIGLISAIGGAFYSLSALQSERRDRSILFWKSMPVSDTTAVLTKLFVVMVIVPVIAFAVTVVTQLLLLIFGTIALTLADGSAALIWQNVQPLQQAVLLLYALATASLWYAPIIAWLLLVSAWAKRATFLWAVLPPAALALFERVAFDTSYIAGVIGHRLLAAPPAAFDLPRGPRGILRGRVLVGENFPENVLSIANPTGLLTEPYLWIGLLVAAAFTAAAIWMRRYREPL